MSETSSRTEEWKWRSKLEAQIRQKEAEPPREFARISRAFAAPFLPEGRGPFVMAVCVYFGAGFIPGLGVLFRFLVSSYVMHAIVHAARGRAGLPWWTMEDLENDLRLSFIFIILNAAVFLPAVAWVSVSRGFLSGFRLAGGAALALAGFFFLPMMLLVGAVTGSLFRAINLSTAVRAIGRVLGPYLATVAMCLLALLVLSRLGGLLPSPSRLPLAGGIVVSFLGSALGLYGLLAAGLVLGRFYYNCLEGELDY